MAKKITGRGRGAVLSGSKAWDLAGELDPQMYQRAYEEGLSFSAYLEQRDPSKDYDFEITEPDGRDPINRVNPGAGRTITRKMDAFERQLMAADIITQTDVYNGIRAHTVERFYMSDNPDSLVLFPEFIARQIRANALLPSILDSLIAMTTGIDRDVYRSFYITEDTDAQRMRRVEEGAEVPLAILTGGEHVIDLKKYGRRLESTYETIRHMALDRLAFHITRLAQQYQLDKAEAAISILINGDGNSDTNAETINLSSMDSSAGGSITGKAWINFMLQYNEPYKATTIIGEKDRVAEMLIMNIGSANLTLAALAQIEGALGSMVLPEPVVGPFRVYGRNLTDLTDRILSVDRANALEHVTEVGAALTEVDRIISRQFTQIVITEVSGFAVLAKSGVAAKDLDLTG